MTTTINHINKKSSFKLLVPLEYTGVDFRFRYYTTNIVRQIVEVSCIGGEYTNCEKVDDGSILALFDEDSFKCGILKVEKAYVLPDAQMPDGDFSIVSDNIVEAYYAVKNEEGDIETASELCHIEITNGAQDCSETAEQTTILLGTVLKGKSAYQSWLDNGHTGTEEEFLEWLRGGGIGEAPADGEQYARQDKSITELFGGGATTVTVTDSTSSMTFDEIASAIGDGDVECVFKGVTVGDSYSVTGYAPIIGITALATDTASLTAAADDATQESTSAEVSESVYADIYQATLTVMLSATDIYMVTAAWKNGDSKATITTARMESGLAIDETDTTDEEG